MNYIIALFNLKEGVSREDYEAWAQASDLPTVRGLPSIGGFDVFRLSAVRNSEKPLPFQYVEIIAVDEMTQYRADVTSDAMQALSAQFRQFADDPMFITSEKLGA